MPVPNMGYETWGRILGAEETVVARTVDPDEETERYGSAWSLAPLWRNAVTVEGA